MIFLLTLSVLWILVPFASFGIKPLLRDVLAEQRKSHVALAAIYQEVQAATLAIAPPAAPRPPGSRWHRLVRQE